LVLLGGAILAACGARTALPVDGNEAPPFTSSSSGGTSGAPPPEDAGARGRDDGGPRPPVTDGAPDMAVLPSCLASSHQTHGVPTDLYFMVDKSLSMNTIDPGTTASRWVLVSMAMNAFLNSPDSVGLGAGIAFFPIPLDGGAGGRPAADCTPSDYAMPVQPMALLPAVALPISAAIAAQTLSTGTPTTPALEGAYAYAQALQRGSPDRTVAVVMVTDGNPLQCGSTIANASAAAAVGAAASPPIRTYVLGIGPSLANLNAIAAAGGTGHAYLVQSGGGDALTAALNAIRADTISCEYALPPLDGGPFDAGGVNVQDRVGLGGTVTMLSQVSGAAACGPGGGWFFDDGAQPKWIILCPTSCNPLLQTVGSTLDIVVDCN
jgi:hypothetical protein